MNKVNLAEETKFDADEIEQREQLRAVIAYDTIAAGKRAVQVVTGIANRSGADEEFHPTAWSFSLLTDQEWAQISTDDVIKADILIVAADGPLPSSIVEWIEGVIEQKRGTSAAIVALPGTERADAPSAGWDTVELAVLRAGLSYFKSSPHSTRNAENVFEGSEWAVCGE